MGEPVEALSAGSDVTHGWFVWLAVSMVTNSHATGLEKTLIEVWLEIVGIV